MNHNTENRHGNLMVKVHVLNHLLSGKPMCLSPQFLFTGVPAMQILRTRLSNKVALEKEPGEESGRKLRRKANRQRRAYAARTDVSASSDFRRTDSALGNFWHFFQESLLILVSRYRPFKL